MTNEQLQDMIDRASAENYKGNFPEAEQLSNEVVEYLRSNSADNSDISRLLLSRALFQLAFSLRRRGEGLWQESLHAAEEAYSLAVEAGSRIDIARALGAIGASYQHGSEYARSMEYCSKALAIFEELGDESGIAITKLSHGITYKTLGDYQRALQLYSEILPVFEKLGDKLRIADTVTELAQIHNAIGSHDIALEYFQRGLSYFQEIGNVRMIAGTTANIGGVYFSKKDFAPALEYFGKALSILEETNEKLFRTIVTWNIGATHYFQGDINTAMEYFRRCLAMYEQFGHQDGIANATGGIGELYANEMYEGYDAVAAEEFLLRSIAIIEKLGLKTGRDQYTALTELYSKQKRWEEALAMFKKYHNVEKELKHEQVKQQANKLEFERTVAEREKQYAVERADAEATKRLLHKTLPPSIADRVIQGETRVADHFESASVLFADVVGFTKISAQMPPAAVLAFMNFIFEHFDALAAKHGCERIKTIGDGYMAVCGAPVRYPNHAQRLALMALDMMEDIILPEEIREHLPKGTLFHLRIGLHCGEITAGLIGTGKLAYDIYGDAVNTAARMESHGEAGRIHVSGEFRNALAGAENFLPLPIQFISRGEVEIKGKGTMRTYFLENRSKQ
jgi:class 3 adenylate cyclase/Tfp pilus assembly protein PilF